VVEELQKYLIYKQSYSQFSVEIYQFLLPRQQGKPPKDPVWCKNLGPILNLSGCILQ